MRFFTLSEVKNELNLRKNEEKPNISIVGELSVAIQFFKAFTNGFQEIKFIEWKHREGIDLTIKFLNRSETKVEVKSSLLKKDYLQNILVYGVSIKEKDFSNRFDLLAMVNFKNDFEVDQYFYFPFEIFEKIKPNPYYILPQTILTNLYKEYPFHKNDFYKEIIIPKSGQYPNWFGEKELCPFIREYRLSLKHFYEEEIVKKREIMSNLALVYQKASKLKSKIFQEVQIHNDYPVNYCLNCSEKCTYILNSR